MKRLMLFLIVLLVLGGAALLLFEKGYVRFNYPERGRFPVQGIDVSHHQGHIDWAEVKEAGVDFAYIKATEGGDFTDERFQDNWKETQKHNILRGAYHFFTLCRPGAEQAAHFISVVPRDKNALPPAVDLEYTGNCNDSSKQLNFAAELKTFYRKIKARYGTTPIIYTTYEFHEHHELSPYMARLWIRDIYSTPDLSRYDWTFWQYTNRLRVPGIAAPVDGNVFRTTKARLRHL
jgi:lysozyme